MNKNAKPYLVWGSGGHGRVVADIVLSLGFEINGFIDADVTRHGAAVMPTSGLVVFSERIVLSDQKVLANSWIALGVGENATRLKMLESLGDSCAPPLIHPRATVSRFAKVGLGSVVLAGAVVNAGASIGAGAIINTGAIVEHDCILGEGTHVSPGAVLTGGVQVGRLSWIGANATVLPGIRIGQRVIVGAGAVVRLDVEDQVTAAGNPARIIHRGTS